MKVPRSVLVLGIFVICAAVAAAGVPVSVLQPKQVRGKIVDLAVSFMGRPYKFGGSEPSGFDCSGLVFHVYSHTVGGKIPRTAREQMEFADPVAKASLQEGDLVFFRNDGVVDHVGIYIGGGYFVHSVSDRLIPGVIQSSLKEMYWASRFAGGGRIIPASGDIGIPVPVFANITLSNGFGLRGAEAGVGVVLPFTGGEIGLEVRVEYDGMLGVVRTPALLSISPDRKVKFFAGPALCFGAPIFREGGGERTYEAAGGVFGVAGISWKPLAFKVGKVSVGLVGELVYEGYRDTSGLGQDTLADAAARIKVGFGVEIR
ncbi:MAG: C40 family peptidase [Rectinemataceae bacterium]|nr:C40 family peptidase [Rectinemataceae bacterium]